MTKKLLLSNSFLMSGDTLYFPQVILPGGRELYADRCGITAKVCESTKEVRFDADDPYFEGKEPVLPLSAFREDQFVENRYDKQFCE